jgi:hypothetical protein
MSVLLLLSSGKRTSTIPIDNLCFRPNPELNSLLLPAFTFGQEGNWGGKEKGRHSGGHVRFSISSVRTFETFWRGGVLQKEFRRTGYGSDRQTFRNARNHNQVQYR